ncbi:MAG: ABC transporter permease [Candidatus Hydrogenedentes bacterium]|nr:ABC transporter permease [Candidatus Hydrogenedentota bacterium]
MDRGFNPLWRAVSRQSPLILFAGLCVVFAVISPEFRNVENLMSVAYRTSVIGIMCLGELLVIITAGIDLSVGSVAALASMSACLLMKSLHSGGYPPLLTVSVGLVVGVGCGALCGLINGLLITKGKLPPFIATLGMMMCARGVTLIISGAQTIYGLPQSFSWLGGTEKWWIPVSITGGLAVIFAIVLAFTRFGRSLYAIGGNKTATKLSGIRVDSVCTIAYTLCGITAGLAGLVLASRTSVADPNAALTYELDAIAACVIGGASLMGGEGGAITAFAGALIIMVLRNFCTIENFNVYWQQVFVGVLLVILVFYDTLRKRLSGQIQD